MKKKKRGGKHPVYMAGWRPQLFQRLSDAQVSKTATSKQASNNKHMVIPVSELGKFSAKIYLAYPIFGVETWDEPATLVV